MQPQYRYFACISWTYKGLKENLGLYDCTKSCFINQSTQYIASLFKSVQNYNTSFSWYTGKYKRLWKFYYRQVY